MLFGKKGGKNRTDCVFLDKFIFHDLIAFLETGGKNRTVLSFEGRYSKRKGALVGWQKFFYLGILSKWDQFVLSFLIKMQSVLFWPANLYGFVFFMIKRLVCVVSLRRIFVLAISMQ